MQRKQTGFVIYRGPSLIDGAPIVAVALAGKSSNVKTGAMVQTYILRADIAPIDAVKRGLDVSICGECPHRGTAAAPFDRMPADRSCYVNLGQGPRAVFDGYSRGIYADACAIDGARFGELLERIRGRMVRLGTYGDPAAVPAHVWRALIVTASGHTGYSHQWRNAALDQAQRDAIGALCMASADSEADATAARAAGLRYFRVRTPSEPIGPREFVCPASAEGDKRKTCAQCGACDGSARGPKASPVIIAHGSLASRFIRLRQI